MASIMFVCPGFHEYDKIIEEALKKQGNDVSKLIPIGKYTVAEKLWNRITGGRYIKKKLRKRQERYLLGDNKKYDYVFVIAGKSLEIDILEQYKKQQPQAEFILYLWDDISRVPGYFEMAPYFDEIYTFAQTDAEQYHLHFLPMFIPDTHVYAGEEKRYRFNLSGMLHSERLEIWDRIVTDCDLREEDCYIYLMGTRMKHFLQVLLPGGSRWMKRKYIHVNSTSFQNIGANMKRSRVTLDIQHAAQKGVTSRTIEALGAHTKVISTNQYARESELYRYGNIYIIDRENPKVPRSFFEEEYHVMPEEIYQKYHIDHWVQSMFGAGEKQ